MGRGKPRVQGVTLAGVHAWGECVLDWVCPRPLLPLAGRPLVWYPLEWMRRGGVREISVCANGDTESIRSCLGGGDGLGMMLRYHEDPMPRGPAGCARDAGLASDADLLVLIEGSTLPALSMDLAVVLAAHQESRAALTVVASERASNRPGLSALEPLGIYIISRFALEQVPAKGYQDIKEMLIPRLYELGYRTVPYGVSGDAGQRVMGVSSYMSATMQIVAQTRAGDAWLQGYDRVENAWVHASARVEEDVRLIGPSLIGPGAVVEGGASIIGPAIIGPKTRIGAEALVSGSVAWTGCSVGEAAVLTRCLLLDGSVVESGLAVRDTVWQEPAPAPAFTAGPDAYWALCSPPAGEPAGAGPSGRADRMGLRRAPAACNSRGPCDVVPGR